MPALRTAPAFTLAVFFGRYGSKTNQTRHVPMQLSARHACSPLRTGSFAQANYHRAVFEARKHIWFGDTEIAKRFAPLETSVSLQGPLKVPRGAGQYAPPNV